jgi:hypothetical protein
MVVDEHGQSCGCCVVALRLLFGAFVSTSAPMSYYFG